jgi:hypothetical protein
MGYGVSPILGYFIALALCARSTVTKLRNDEITV